jgi:hypothetical protein
MNLPLLAWCAAGVIAGAGHAASIWRNARGRRPGRGAGPRMLAVALVLFGSALAGQLLPVAAGWAAGLFVTGVLLAARRSV